MENLHKNLYIGITHNKNSNKQRIKDKITIQARINVILNACDRI